jgi:P pilus assembly chaperone PapD
VVVSQRASAQLLVDPLEVTMITSGNNRVSGSFSLSNSSDAAVQATITRQDWDRVENGDNRFLPPGANGMSCGTNLTVSPLSIRVEAHSSRIIRLGAQNAAPLSKECWDIIFVEEVPQRAAIKGNSLQYIFRTGVKVYVAPSGLARDGQVEDMALADSATTRRIGIRFHNTGGMHLLAKGRLEFRRLDNTLAMQVPIAEFPTLPGAVRKLVVDVPTGLAPGDYVVLALIDFGGAELVAGQIDYQAK